MHYERLFQEGRIGPMVLKNRGVMMPMATDMADKDGIVTPRQIRYYQERAKGGVAMIINEYTGVDDVDSIPSIHNLRAARDYHISELEKLTDAVHLYDCKIVAQLHHGGATSNPALTGRENIAPSAVPIAPGRPVPREMTLEDIARVRQKFVDAAVRCKKAGYDAVELHGAHGYLIAQFFSKYYNRRTDDYGGSVENRCRFVAEIIAGIRAKLGRFPILVRMCGDEMTPVEGFLSLEEGIEIARYLESCGIDAINISNGSARNGDANCEPFSYQPGWKKHVAKAYKEALHIPVIATNTIKDPDFAEQLLEEGVCDFVGLGRSQLADPEFMKKAREGRADEIRRCIGCLYCRERVIGNGLPMRCAVNARTGREDAFPHLRADGAGRTVAVVGGGPAGMEAARILALRKFRVVLFEKAEELGGTLNVADKPALKDKLTRLKETMRTQLAKLDVDVRLGVEATPELVQALDPAGVIIACGAEPVVPPLPGIGLPHVCTAESVLLGQSAPSGKVAVIGSGLTGLETSEVLLSRGLSLSIVEMADTLGPGIFGAILNDELSRITPHEPAIYTGHKLVSIEERSITLERVGDGSRVTVDADSVVLALGVRPRTGVVKAFQAAFPQLTAVGDARQGGRIATAIRQGFEAAYVFEA
ncbi:MAG: NAD(P)/FAD-dependent oxidoreductase [Oscillospiraceae bacterium]|nr:NAD(P)/FAD-dependent oxidoreductase [Oscillospiraceae bacterium]